jgi:hypothetical protein
VVSQYSGLFDCACTAAVAKKQAAENQESATTRAKRAKRDEESRRNMSKNSWAMNSRTFE